MFCFCERQWSHEAKISSRQRRTEHSLWFVCIQQSASHAFTRAVCLSVTQIVRCLFLQTVSVCLCSCHCRHVVVVVLQPASRVLLRLENILWQMDFAKRFCLLYLPFVLSSVVLMKAHLDSKCNLLLSCLRCNR